MRTLMVSILFLQASLVFSQNIAITVVNEKNQPLPFAYVLVDNKPIAVCDSVGNANVPLNKIKLYDTISVSYLGALPAWIIFNDSIKANGSCYFHLDEFSYQLNEISVSYSDNEKLLRKSVNLFPALNFDCRMQAKISASIYKNGILSYEGSGLIESVNNKKVPHYWPWFDPSVKYVTESDTLGEWGTLDCHIHLALNFSNLSLSRWQNNKKIKFYYTYLGEQGQNKVFRVVFPKTYFGGWNYQIILNIDKDTKNIKSVKVDALMDNPNGNSERLKLYYDCEIYVQKDQKRRIIYLPDNIRYSYTRLGYVQCDLFISDISLTD
jgi:hypothetical protein